MYICKKRKKKKKKRVRENNYFNNHIVSFVNFILLKRYIVYRVLLFLCGDNLFLRSGKIKY